jgi:hypothetical protein
MQCNNVTSIPIYSRCQCAEAVLHVVMPWYVTVFKHLQAGWQAGRLAACRLKLKKEPNPATKTDK